MPKKSQDGKPERQITAYGFFLRESRLQQKDQDPQQSPYSTAYAEFTRRCKVRWQGMTAKSKERFVKQSVKDKERFEQEMKEYKVSIDQQPPPKKQRKLKDPNAPKKALTAYLCFCNAQRSNVSASSKVTRLGPLVKELARIWKSLPLEDRAQYKVLADKDRQRYYSELTVYKQKKQKIEEAIAAQVVLLAQQQR